VKIDQEMRMWKCRTWNGFTICPTVCYSYETDKKEGIYEALRA